MNEYSNANFKYSGTKVLYDRSVLLQMRSSLLSQSPISLPSIAGVTIPEDSVLMLDAVRICNNLNLIVFNVCMIKLIFILYIPLYTQAVIKEKVHKKRSSKSKTSSMNKDDSTMFEMEWLWRVFESKGHTVVLIANGHGHASVARSIYPIVLNFY